MVYILGALITIISCVFTYFLFQSYIDRIPRKYIIIAFIFCLTIALLGRYLMKGPQFFESGIEQLRANGYVDDKVGDFQSFSYYPQAFKESSTHAAFDVELHGKGHVLFVTCLMDKRGENWILKEIKVNKLTNEPNE
jgi:hypothetical protein